MAFKLYNTRVDDLSTLYSEYCWCRSVHCHCSIRFYDVQYTHHFSSIEVGESSHLQSFHCITMTFNHYRAITRDSPEPSPIYDPLYGATICRMLT